MLPVRNRFPCGIRLIKELICWGRAVRGGLKTFLMTTASAAVLAGGAALAQPAPPPLKANWTGAYVGLNASASAHDWKFTDVGANCGFCNPRTFWDSDKLGIGAGAHAGYNWQNDRAVLGVEADFKWLNVRDTGRAQGAAGVASLFADVDWLSTFRVRAGITASPTILYVTGGLAVGRVNNGWSTSTSKANILRKTKTGWTGGVGIEHMLAANVTGRVELRYVDLGKSTVTRTFCCGPISTQFENSLVEFIGGLSYRW
jgi:outer membrane immunogenic protein